MRIILTGLMLAAPIISAWAVATDDEKARVEQEFTTIITPQIVKAVEAANAERVSWDQAKINEMDAQWMAELNASSKPLIESILSKAESEHLRKILASSNGFYTEIFVFDNKGLNVAQADLTSDFWQGDEAKYTESYGKNATFVDDVEFDESTQTYQVQISMPVKNAGGDLIGGVTFGVQAK